MTVDASQLLRQLEPAVRPGAAPARLGKPQTTLENQSFNELLSLASKGSIESGRQVNCDCDVNEPLDSEQIDRLSAAADRAEATGSQKVLMLMDGRGFVMDIALRTVEAELSVEQQASIFKNIDTAVYVPAEGEQPQSILGPPGNRIAPPGVLQQLEQTQQPPHPQQPSQKIA